MSEEAKGPDVVEGEATLSVTTTHLGQEKERQEKIRIRPFHKQGRVGSVTVKMGRTINLGNYESARVDVAVNAPGYVEELLNVYHETRAMVEERITEEVRRIEGRPAENDNEEKPLEDIL